MRVIPIEKVISGMIIERAILGPTGEVLLSRGMLIDQDYIERLKKMGVPALYVRDDNIGHVEYDEIISDRTRTEVLNVTSTVVKNIKLNNANDLVKIQNAINELIAEIMTSHNLLVALVDMRSINDEGLKHSVNTAVLAIITGIAMGYSREKLKDLAAGTLFHDIGMLLLPVEIVGKKDKLSVEEDELIRSHPQLGFDLLRKKHLVSSVAAHIALQHHEKYDGSGYPQGLAGEEIREMARIVTITALYDNIVGIRQKEKELLPHQAIEYLSLYVGKWFDPKIFKIFCSCIAVFPVGVVVLLNTGESAVVVKANKSFPSRPKVRIFKDRTGSFISPPFEIDLALDSEYFIMKVQLDD
jgi:HD-GYP domain-containing protein (c-di-GMP phosphodiesterase class II)